ncbi:MAG TPA: glutamine synthetase beta-grasp domain-containing protein, partial [Nakamurella sp.]|nr:glutamine synthetase beta-grasp domain-containing protein [Nakamurella sp.]
MFSTTEELVAYIKDNDVEVFDIRFCDLLGIMNHLSVPAATVTEKSLADGMAFDGSSIRGFQSIHESDMTLLPDVTT